MLLARRWSRAQLLGPVLTRYDDSDSMRGTATDGIAFTLATPRMSGAQHHLRL